MTLPFARFKIENEVYPSDDEQSVDVRSLAKISIVASSRKTIDSYIFGLEIYNTLFELWQEKYPAETISKIVDFILPAETVPTSIVNEARILGKARCDIFFSGDWINSREWDELAAERGTDPEVRSLQYLKDRLIFSIRHADVDYFPLYGLDDLNKYQPVAGLHEIIELLTEHKDGWAFAFWFASPNTFLGAKAPKDVIATDPRAVMAAAMEEVHGLRHG